ncbi:MAG: hypothetical protein JSS66_11430 [Armatimonadetes bacterium]|nr:hypothetical protein [Armatimonadota bacterium]
MKFRKIYWVTEQLGSDGTSTVAGVYTSINDLIERGINWKDGCEKQAAFRLTLAQLDSRNMPLGSWTSPGFDGLEGDLAPLVAGLELSGLDVDQLCQEIRAFCS